MRVALVIQKLAGIRGGAERVLADLARELAARGHDTTVVTFEPSAEPPAYVFDRVPVVGIFPPVLGAVLRRTMARASTDPAEELLSPSHDRVPLAALRWHATHGVFARRLTRWLRENPQDAVVGFMPPAISAVALAGESLGDERPRTIASTHNVPSIDFGEGGRWDPNPVARRTNLRALELVDVVTVLLPEFVDELPLPARADAVVLPNAVSRLGEPTGSPRRDLILGVGRLTSVKRYDLLIDAFARVADDHPTWDLTICGDGPEREALEGRIATHAGLAGRIRLAGPVADIAARYDEARILAHPASFEGFGLAVAEAILHDLVVIASEACSGVNQLVEPPHTGILVHEGHDPVAAFADGLRTLMTSPPPDEARRAARDRLGDRLDAANIVALWESVLRGSAASDGEDRMGSVEEQ